MKTSSVFLLIALGATLTQGYLFKSDGCPEPYDRLDETRCILTDPFVARNYTDAIAYCKTHGGVLLHFDNCADQTLFYDYIQTEVGLASHHYWLAATDEAEEGVWLWDHDKKPVPMGSPFWYVGEPNGGTSYNCVVLSYSYTHRWVDTYCHYTNYAICLKAI
ncbi:perlucin-like protein [Eriocheir sinensis]|uniref:perlucin-like protein n=1 Tax=Eriocheir sinensis TaxID=95602 RepID=UPI0021C5DB25|nr:perlucin-like protein [Eriocheir sinensis]